MRDIIVGIAGHIDHGKSSIVKAMTGFDGDTLDEEKRRGITIDLSFSHMNDGSTNVAFIDVPGHEKLVKNMIAGAFGFDGVVLVVDANEGIKPQTLEHLGILNLLGIEHILLAITKTDLCSIMKTEETTAKAQELISEYKNLKLFDTQAVSIHDDTSIQRLKERLFQMPKRNRQEHEVFRCYIDRSFTIKGAGNVVTGTILSGTVETGEKIWLCEESTQMQVRNIQVHDKDTNIAKSSQRVAINLTGKKASLRRGELLTRKGYLRGFESIDVYLESLPNREIKHNTKVEFFIGSKQIQAKVLLYESPDSIQRGFARLVFDESVFAMFDEPFIIMLSGRVIAGGRVLNPINDPIKNRVKIPLLHALKNRDFLQAFEILAQNHKKGFGLVSSTQRFALTHQEALDIANELEDVFLDSTSLVLYPTSTLELLQDNIQQIYSSNTKALLSPKSLSSKIKWASNALLQTILEQMTRDGKLVLDNGIYKDANTKIDNISDFVKAQIYQRLIDDGIKPEAPYNIYDSLDIDNQIGDSALKELTSSKKVTRLAHNIFITSENLAYVVSKMRAIIADDGQIELSNFKSNLPTLSRKYLVAYLEYLDNFSDIKKDANRRYFI